jgi:hypothetical protein
MAGPLFDAVERAQLSDLLGELGPGAPTLLAPWTTRDLAAHLVLRERDYLASRILDCTVLVCAKASSTISNGTSWVSSPR